MPPPPPDQELIRWKRTTIQHRNHYNPQTKKHPERDALHRRHHPDSWSHADYKAKAKRGKEKAPGVENIKNLIITDENAYGCCDEEKLKEMFDKKNREHEELQRHLGPLDSHGRPRSPSAPKPPMFKAPIPLNARKPKYNSVGFMGGGSGVADPRRFVKCGSGGIGPTVSKANITKPGIEAKKWTRPLDKDFVPKMGKPKVTPPKKGGGMEEKIPKRNFLKDNKAGAVKVVVKNKPEVPKKLALGKQPNYLVERRAQQRFEFEKAESERIVRREERKDRRRMRRKERSELLNALRARRDRCVGLLTRAEIGGGREKIRRKLEIEISWLDKDVARLEGEGTVVVVGLK